MGLISDSRMGVMVGCVCAGVGALADHATSLLLHSLGFSRTGPAAGSFAAKWMSDLARANGGAIPPHSLFSWCQSVVMKGEGMLGASTLITIGVIAFGLYVSGCAITRSILYFSAQRNHGSKPKTDEERRLLPAASKNTTTEADRRSNDTPYSVWIPDEDSESAESSFRSCAEDDDEDDKDPSQKPESRSGLS